MIAETAAALLVADLTSLSKIERAQTVFRIAGPFHRWCRHRRMSKQQSRTAWNEVMALHDGVLRGWPCERWSRWLG